ncbi:MAG: hypothetical protein EXR05_00480 [Acetobacteraceae bacterium]|nr:hypothetical protein [Acetobacteraceae bacterium]
MTLTRRALLAATGVTLALERPARAAQKRILLVGAAPGSAADRTARAFAPFLVRHMPHSVLSMLNIAGESGLAAYRILAAAEPTGTMIGFLSTPSLPARMVDRGAGALMDQITLLGAVHKEPITIVSPATSPLTSPQDLFRRSSTDMDGVPFGTPAQGSAAHLAALRLQAVAGAPLNLIAFPSSSAVRQAVIAGHVAAAALSLSDALDPLRDGKLIGLGLAARDRLEAIPNLPTLRDAGLALSAFIRRGLAVPAGTPDDVAQRLIEAMRTILVDPEFTTQANETGTRPFWTPGPDWTTQAQAERAELAQLWQSNPWLPNAAS